MSACALGASTASAERATTGAGTSQERGARLDAELAVGACSRDARCEVNCSSDSVERAAARALDSMLPRRRADRQCVRIVARSTPCW
jgi:hypothetical protein